MKSDLRRFAGFLALATAFAVTAVAQDDKPAAKADDTELPDPVAVVEGEKISRADLQQTFNNALAASGISRDDLTADQKMAGYREILDELIVDKLISRKASTIDVTEADIDAEFVRLRGQFSNETAFKEALENYGESESSLKEQIKRGLQTERWMQQQIGDEAKISDEEARKLYDDNPQEFELPERVRASHILIRVPEDASDEVVAEKKKAAEAALARVAGKNEDFTAVAKEVSEEPGAKESGGDLNFFPKDRMLPEFSEAAFAMKKGDISKEPVRTKFGWHIIHVTDRKAAGKHTFEDVKEKLVSYLAGAKRREAIRAVTDSLRSEAKVENKLPADKAVIPAAPKEG